MFKILRILKEQRKNQTRKIVRVSLRQTRHKIKTMERVHHHKTFLKQNCHHRLCPHSKKANHPKGFSNQNCRLRHSYHPQSNHLRLNLILHRSVGLAAPRTRLAALVALDEADQHPAGSVLRQREVATHRLQTEGLDSLPTPGWVEAHCRLAASVVLQTLQAGLKALDEVD